MRDLLALIQRVRHNWETFAWNEVIHWSKIMIQELFPVDSEEILEIDRNQPQSTRLKLQKPDDILSTRMGKGIFALPSQVTIDQFLLDTRAVDDGDPIHLIPWIDRWKIIKNLHDVVPSAFKKSTTDPLTRCMPRPYKSSPFLIDGFDIPDQVVERVLSPEDSSDELESRVEECGTEALAWYRSYHWEPWDSEERTLWGIYILLDGLVFLARKLIRELPEVPREILSRNPRWAIRYVLEDVWQHECFHFLVDSYATTFEFLLKQPFYVPYIMNFYAKGWPTCSEEALANRYVLEKLKQSSGAFGHGPLHRIHFVRTLEQSFLKQPEGYRNYDEFLEPRSFQGGLYRLCCDITRSVHPGHTIDILHSPVGINPREDVPLHLVH